MKISYETLFEKVLNKDTPIFVKEGKAIVQYDDIIVSQKYVSSTQLLLVDKGFGDTMYLDLDKYGEYWALSEEELR